MVRALFAGIALFVLTALSSGDSVAQTISTVAGGGPGYFGGDGGAATSAALFHPYNVAVDGSGNVYIADTDNHRIRKVTASTGKISTVAGNGNMGFSGDGGDARLANLSYPRGVAVDGAGNVYIADTLNARIRKLTISTGKISTVAGWSGAGFSGDGGPATSAQLSEPRAIALDGSGNLYIADELNGRIRKVTVSSGTISTVAGNGGHGFTGDGVLATKTALFAPRGVAVDAAGNVYVADYGNNRIRKVTAATGIISTVAGNGMAGFSGNGGAATSARLNYPEGVAVDGATNIYVADTQNNVVRKVSVASGVIVTYAGNLACGFGGDGGPAASAALCTPMGVALDSDDNLYVADTGNNRIRKVPVPDTTPPTITKSVSGNLGSDAWYVGNVSLTWTAEDPDSAISTSTGCGGTTVTTDTAGTVFTCSATSEGGTSQLSVTIKRDASPPTASATGTPAPNATGWNQSAVTVNFQGTDAVSGIASCSPSQTLSSEGANQSSTGGSCTDRAGNVSAPAAATGINIDLTRPTVSAVRNPATGNGVGWNNVPVTVSFLGTDGLSGVPLTGCQAPITLSGDGAGQSATGTCTDRAGNIGSITLGGISIDTTPPVASAQVTPAPNAAGWNRSDVTVSFSGTDAMSGSAIAGCSTSVPATTETSGHVLSGTCIDRADNLSPTTSVTVRLDKTEPVASITQPVAGANYLQGTVINALYGCSDLRSGIAQCNGPVANGAPIDTATVGDKTFEVTAIDVAGNSSAMTVAYSIISASAPVPPAIAPQSAMENQAFSFIVPAFVSPNGRPLTYSYIGLPSWLAVASPSVNPRYLSGRPPYAESSPSANAVYTITVTAADPEGNSATAKFPLTVENVNRAPTAPSVPNQVAYETKSFGYSVPAFSDPDGEPLSYVFSGLPAWLKVTAPDVNPRYISGRPPLSESSPDGNASYLITLTATDPNGASTARSFRVVVADNRYPVPGAIANQVATENVAFSYNMPAFTDPDGDAISYTFYGVPSWLKVTDPAVNPRYLSGKPPYTESTRTQQKSYTITVNARDAVGQTTQRSFTLTVTNVNRPPVPPSIADQTAYEGSAFSFNAPRFTDPDGDTLAYSLSGLPGWLKVTDPAVNDRYISGRPPYTEATPGSPAVYAITMTATDPDGLSSSRTFNLTVQDTAN